MNPTDAAPSGVGRRCMDRLSELIGGYRMLALMRGNRIALGAVVTSPSRLAMDGDVQVQRGSVLHAGGKGWCAYGGWIRLAAGVRIGPHCVLYGAGGIHIGEHTHLGPGVKLMSQSGRHTGRRTTSTPDYSFEPISIGSGVWLGAGAVVLGGARIGNCVTVAPNSVVSGTIADYAVVVGNPGRVMYYNTKEGSGSDA